VIFGPDLAVSTGRLALAEIRGCWLQAQDTWLWPKSGAVGCEHRTFGSGRNQGRLAASTGRLALAEIRGGWLRARDVWLWPKSGVVGCEHRTVSSSPNQASLPFSSFRAVVQQRLLWLKIVNKSGVPFADTHRNYAQKGSKTLRF
jgi:hypothetical protein